jgi:hypothetical protein
MKLLRRRLVFEPRFTPEKRVQLALYGRQVFHGCIGLSASHKVGGKKSAHAADTAGRATTGGRP